MALRSRARACIRAGQVTESVEYRCAPGMTLKPRELNDVDRKFNILIFEAVTGGRNEPDCHTGL